MKHKDTTASKQKTALELRRELTRSPVKELRRLQMEASKKRFCRKCGKLIEGPNYFFCVECHRQIDVDASMLDEIGSW
jgi:hypothetical protein